MTQDAGNTFARARRIQFRDDRLRLNNSLSETDSADFYRFEITHTRTFRAALDRIDGNAELVLYNRSRQVIATSNEADGEAESIVAELEAGQYFLEVRSINGSFDYNLRGSAILIERKGSSFSEAIEIEQNGRETGLRGRVTERGDVDASERLNRFEYYQFTLDDRTRFSSTLRRLSADCDFTLYDSNRRVLFTSDRQGFSAERINQVLDAGIYFLRVRTKQSETRFELDLNFNAVRINGNTIETAQTIAVSSEEQTVDNFIGGSDRNDYYRVNLTTAGTFDLSIAQLSDDATLQIINSSGTVVATSATLAANQDQLSVYLSSGTYYVRVFTATTTTTVTRYEYRYEFTEFTQTIGTPPVILPGVTTNNAIEPNTEDFYRFDLTVPSRLDLKIDGLTANADLQLLDAEGNVIDSSLNAGTEPDIVLNNLNPGTYFVRVFLAEGASATPYRLGYTLYDLPVFALNDENRLTALDPNLDEPGKDLAFVDITGLSTGETMQAIDFRPSDGRLYGISNADRLYTISLTTGAATPVGTAPLSLTGESVGFDFDPRTDRLRIVSETGENQQVDPLTGAIVAVDAPLAYAVGDPFVGSTPQITASAYSENRAGRVGTTLYGIDTNLDILVRQDGSTLSTVGRLNLDFQELSGFEIFTDANGVNTGYAATNNTVYRIDLTTGAATTVTGVVDSVTQAPYTLIGVAVRPT